jgi:hypothetical protein
MDFKPFYSERRVGKLEAAASSLQKQTKSRRQVEKEIEEAKLTLEGLCRK